MMPISALCATSGRSAPVQIQSASTVPVARTGRAIADTSRIATTALLDLDALGLSGLWSLSSDRSNDARLATLRDIVYRADISIRYITSMRGAGTVTAREAATCPARSC